MPQITFTLTIPTDASLVSDCALGLGWDGTSGTAQGYIRSQVISLLKKGVYTKRVGDATNTADTQVQTVADTVSSLQII